MATQKQNQNDGSARPLISEFAGDAEMAELIEYFTGELNDGIEQLTRAWQEGNYAHLCKLAHQLKGAAGGYGFPSITNSAAELEGLLLAGQIELSSLSEKFEDLIALCKRAVGDCA